jgi:lysophospholipid acyltransferase (LPLAT)-like uncharacterized protein
MQESERTSSEQNIVTPAHFSSKFTGTAIWAFSSAIGLTWRVRLSGNTSMAPSCSSDQGRIFAFWHSHLLPLSFFFRNSSITAIVSRSRDGILASYIAGKWGHSVISGSSHRGGSTVLRQSLKTLHQKQSIAITPDEPRGPKEQVKSGTAQLAMLSKAPVIVLSVYPQNAWRLNSWDKFIIPKPFSKLTIHVSQPVYANEAPESDDKVESIRKLIQRRFDEAATMAT